jgi:hypothetical protein
MDDERAALLGWMQQGRSKKRCGMGLVGSLPVVAGLSFALGAGAVAAAPLLYLYSFGALFGGLALWVRGARQEGEAWRFLDAHEGTHLLPAARVVQR